MNTNTAIEKGNQVHLENGRLTLTDLETRVQVELSFDLALTVLRNYVNGLPNPIEIKIP